MDLLNTFLNVTAPPFTFITLLFLVPPFQIFKYFLSFFSSFFSEDVYGKVVLITGASSGIGEQLAYEYAQRGACLVLSARREGSLREVADLCLELGSPDAIVVPADVAKVDDCRRVIDATISRYGGLNHLVNNAGVVGDINFWGSVYTTRYAIPHLRKSGGKIVVMSSSASWMPVPRESFYNASKAAMTAFFETLRVELGSDVKITVVTPGVIESELTRERAARSIIRGVCRGDRYVTVPAWFKVTYFLKVLFPEVLEWTYRLLYLTSTHDIPTGTPEKHKIDYPGARGMLYPGSPTDVKRK
ncbi:11-beta-hydroxysteroid dehydrogenase 1B [Bienertia sinuspersici]